MRFFIALNQGDRLFIWCFLVHFPDLKSSLAP